MMHPKYGRDSWMARKKILVADDSKTVLMIDELIVRRLSYDIVTALDGREALAKAIEEKPDLILMDVVMPNLNGFEAVKQLRANEETKKIPIIMVTTRGEPENMVKGYECGCDDYVTKPIDIVDLSIKIQRLIGE
jgi:DNA-binding response OmpR family regulator